MGEEGKDKPSRAKGENRSLEFAQGALIAVTIRLERQERPRRI